MIRRQAERLAHYDSLLSPVKHGAAASVDSNLLTQQLV